LFDELIELGPCCEGHEFSPGGVRSGRVAERLSDLGFCQQDRSDHPGPGVRSALCAAPGVGGACGTTLAAASDRSRSQGREATQHTSGHDHNDDAKLKRSDRVAAQLATAAFQDVSAAALAGYASTLDTLGCFQDTERGGIGVHYLNDKLLDAALDIAHPEALVDELDATGAIAGLVAHEYIVPTAAWDKPEPPRLAGIRLHRHPTLPLWLLHTWLWKGNPAGLLNDWNPAVRLCPDGVPIFGVDRPRPEPTTTPTTTGLGPRPGRVT
jgi:hypothetical protein